MKKNDNEKYKKVNVELLIILITVAMWKKIETVMNVW